MNELERNPASPGTDIVVCCENLGKTYREGDLVTPVFAGLELSVARGSLVAWARLPPARQPFLPGYPTMFPV